MLSKNERDRSTRRRRRSSDFQKMPSAFEVFSVEEASIGLPLLNDALVHQHMVLDYEAGMDESYRRSIFSF